MKLEYLGTGKVMIEGIAHEFKNGDTLDLPDDVALQLLKANRFFKKVLEIDEKPKIIKLRKEGK